MHWAGSVNPFLPTKTFLYVLKTPGNLAVFWCFHGVEKHKINNKKSAKRKTKNENICKKKTFKVILTISLASFWCYNNVFKIDFKFVGSLIICLADFLHLLQYFQCVFRHFTKAKRNTIKSWEAKQGLIQKEKVHIEYEKCAQISILANKIAAQWWPILPLRSPNKLQIAFIFYFFVIMFTLCSWFDLKSRIAFNGSFSFVQDKFGHAQISVPKIGIPMSKTVCINPC